MRKRMVAAVACVGLLIGAPGVEAGECVVNAQPVAPHTLTNALEVGPGASLPGQLSGVPFSAVSYESVSISWAGCADECSFLQFEGDTQCGNLVATPIDSVASLEIAGLPDPPAFSDASAEQSPSGKWSVLASSFVSPNWEEDDGSAAYLFELGTRDVIDVSGGSGMLPLEIGLRAASHLTIQFCAGGLFRWIPSHDLRFRVTEQTTFPPFTRNVVDTVIYDQFFVADDVFSVEVSTPSVLTVDVWFKAIANATGANDIFGNQCSGGVALLDFTDEPPLGGYPGDGIQVFLSPDPSLTLVPRSGFVYQPVPEPAAGATAAVATLLVLRVQRRALAFS